MRFCGAQCGVIFGLSRFEVERNTQFIQRRKVTPGNSAGSDFVAPEFPRGLNLNQPHACCCCCSSSATRPPDE